MSSDKIYCAIPYSQLIPRGCRAGLTVSVRGMSREKMDRFEFDFQEGPLINPRDPSVFSMIVYMNTPLVLLTSWKNGKTVHTDRYERHIPFQVMVEFDVQLRVKAEYYEVHVNGKPTWTCKHYLPKESAKYFMILGLVEVYNIKIDYDDSDDFTPQIYGQPGYPKFNLPVPYEQHVVGGLSTGRMVFISGVPSKDSKKFSIEFGIRPHFNWDIGFCFTVFFEYKRRRNMVGGIDRVNMKWGVEEVLGKEFPFKRNERFDIVFKFDLTTTRVAVNNKHFCLFKNRVKPTGKMDSLFISDGVQTMMVNDLL